RRWVVIAMLLALHAALMAEPGEQLQRAWLLVHFGLFLLWQPFIAAERELELFPAALLLTVTAITLYFLAGWMIVGWLLILIGILGGRVFTVRGSAQHKNRFYLFAFGYVLAVLLLRAVPVLVLSEDDVRGSLQAFIEFGLPLVLAPLAFLPLGPAESDGNQVFDFFYAVLVFQLGVVVVLGSIALMRYTDDAYFTSVALTVLGFGAALFVLAVLWNPMRGFGGLRTSFSRYLLSVGMPFELWMRRVAELADSEADAGRFLEQSLREVAAFAWVRGAAWHSPDGDGNVGEEGNYSTRFVHHELEVVFHTETSLSPALFLHMRLLAQVVGEFYEGKRRESALRRNAYLQAVHETGARLTHDVKNLLQSLYALASMAQQLPGEGTGGIMQRQLPLLTQRLRTTLDKLRAPEVAMRELPASSRTWWRDLEKRLAGSGAVLEPGIEMDVEIPQALFDSFVENGIDNVREKMRGEPGIELSIAFTCTPAGIEVSVMDTGSPIEASVARRLFREPIETKSSLGIGLYQSARQAAHSGYRLELAENRQGCVCFTLTREDGALPAKG
ncbi:MAG TPA: sensor histidine kinase, partial [Usitatibacter sp.]|nr:sensor histidine kinase [Usitatibacter sp.]